MYFHCIHGWPIKSMQCGYLLDTELEDFLLLSTSFMVSLNYSWLHVLTKNYPQNKNCAININFKRVNSIQMMMSTIRVNSFGGKYFFFNIF